MNEEEMKMMVGLATAKVLGTMWFAYVYFGLCDVLFDSTRVIRYARSDTMCYSRLGSTWLTFGSGCTRLVYAPMCAFRLGFVAQTMCVTCVVDGISSGVV